MDEDTKEHTWLLGFSLNLLGCTLEQQAQEAAGTPGSPLMREQPCEMAQHWHKPWLPQQVPDTSLSSAKPRQACGKKLFMQGPLLAVGHRTHSTELLPLGFSVWYWIFSLGSCWEPCLCLSQQLCLAGNPSQVQKWLCFLSKVQMLPALLCWSSVWGGRHCWLHGVTASSRFLWLQQWFKFSSAHPCT